MKKKTAKNETKNMSKNEQLLALNARNNFKKAMHQLVKTSKCSEDLQEIINSAVKEVKGFDVSTSSPIIINLKDGRHDVWL